MIKIHGHRFAVKAGLIKPLYNFQGFFRISEKKRLKFSGCYEAERDSLTIFDNYIQDFFVQNPPPDTMVSTHEVLTLVDLEEVKQYVREHIFKQPQILARLHDMDQIDNPKAKVMGCHFLKDLKELTGDIIFISIFF